MKVMEFRDTEGMSGGRKQVRVRVLLEGETLGPGMMQCPPKQAAHDWRDVDAETTEEVNGNPNT